MKINSIIFTTVLVVFLIIISFSASGQESANIPKENKTSFKESIIASQRDSVIVIANASAESEIKNNYSINNYPSNSVKNNTPNNTNIPSNSINDSTENEKIQFAMLMNQIQYSLSAIVKTKDKEILTQQFDFIINRIDQSKLRDRDITAAYEDLLKTIKELTLSENERSFVIEMNERKKKQAYTNALSSFGSVFNPGFSPVTAITSLAYAGISAGLNIVSAKNEADNELKEQLFHIDQKELSDIDDMYINLFGSDNSIIQKYTINPKYRINNNQMDNFITFLAEMNNDYAANIKVLEDINKANTFNNFPIYWLQLGAQYQFNGQNDKAIACYNNFRTLKEQYSYLLYDPFYLAVAKNEIEIYRKQGIGKNKKRIENNLKIIAENTLPQNEPENRLFMAGIYYELGEARKAKNLLELNIYRRENKDYIDYYDRSTEMLSLIEYEEAKKQNKTNSFTPMIMELSSIRFVIDNTMDKNFSILAPKEISQNKFIYTIKDGIVYPDVIPFYTKDNILSFSNEIKIAKNNPFEIIVGIVDKTETTELYYECVLLELNDKIKNRFKEINYSIDDIEPCLLPDIFPQFNNFSYDPKSDEEYKALQSQLMERGYNDRWQKEESKNKLKKLEEDLKVRGPKRKTGEIISNISKNLPNKHYFYSFISKDNKNNILVYSLKKIINNSNSFTCKYYRGQLEKEDKTKFKTKDINNLKQLAVAAINDNKKAQYELAQVYDEPFSEISKKYRASSIYFPGLFSPVFGIPADPITFKDLYGEEKAERNSIVNYWYKKAADNGHGHAAYIYADRLFNGNGIDKNLQEAYRYILIAETNGYKNSNSLELKQRIEKQLKK